MDQEKIQAVRIRRLQYQIVVELVQELRKIGVVARVVCPKCGSVGSLSVMRFKGYAYLVVRHEDKSTHAVSKNDIDIVAAALCSVKSDLERILRGADEACAGGRSTNYNSLREARP